MSTKSALTRHKLILDRLRKSPATLQEILDYVAARTGDDHEEAELSRRTFLRDKEAILELYGIEVVYRKTERNYAIDDSGPENSSRRLLEAFDLMRLLRASEEHAGHVILETRRPVGTEHFQLLEAAIRERKTLKFNYHNYDTDSLSPRVVRPYALKEFRGRWYLLGQRGEEEALKTYGLDRITELEQTGKRFRRILAFDAATHYRDYFGITGVHEAGVQEIELWFDALQGRYVKSLPLHSSQTLLADDGGGIRIRLKLYVTHDFVMELLSYGARMQVIAPESLRTRIRQELENALKLYKNEGL